MNEKIKVVLGTIYPYDETLVKGGVEAVALYLVQELGKREEIELHVVSCNHNVKKDFIEERHGVHFHWISVGKRFYNLRVLTINSYRVRRVYKKIAPDIIHVQGISEYSIAGKKFPKMILTIHGLEAFIDNMKRVQHYSGMAGKYRRFTTNIITQQSIRNACAITSNAGDYLKVVLGKWMKNKPIFYIYNPISNDFFKADKLDKPPILREDEYILWAGQIGERKNLIDLIKVFSIVKVQHRKLKLVLLGPIADQNYFIDVNKLIDELGLQGEVIYVGHIEQKEVVKYYKHADLFVLTSVEETAPMAIAQAIVCGKLVVATKVGGIPYMIEDGINGYLFNFGDVHAISSKIVELLSDKQKTEIIGKFTQQQFAYKYKPENVVDSIVKMYKEILINSYNYKV